jgi:hypothetical protein
MVIQYIFNIAVCILIKAWPEPPDRLGPISNVQLTPVNRLFIDNELGPTPRRLTDHNMVYTREFTRLAP